MAMNLVLVQNDIQVEVHLIKESGSDFKVKMNLETMANFLIKAGKSPDSQDLLRKTIESGGAYETDLFNTIVRVKQYEQESS